MCTWAALGVHVNTQNKKPCFTFCMCSYRGNCMLQLTVSLSMVLFSLAFRIQVKNLPVMQETQVWSLGQEDPLEKGMANHSSILAWRIPQTEEPGGLHSMGSQSQDTTEWQTLSLSLSEVTILYWQTSLPHSGENGKLQATLKIFNA